MSKQLLDPGYKVTKNFSGIFRETFLILTHKCPMNCSYCYINKDVEEEMSYEMIKHFIDNIRPKLGGSNNIVFFGGEPLLKIDIIERIMDEYGNSLGGGVVTGASINMDKYFDIWKKYDLILQVSYDGLLHNRSRKDEFDFGILQRYLDYSGSRFQLRKTINQDNLDSLFDDYILGSKLALNYNVSFDFSLAHRTDYGKNFDIRFRSKLVQIWDYILDRFKNREPVYIPLYMTMILFHIKNYILDKRYSEGIDSCEIGHVLVVDVDGSFYPCTMLSQCGEYFKIGSIDDGIDMERLEFLKSGIGCGCVYNKICGGGCRWERFKVYGENDMHTSVRPEHCRTMHSQYISAMEFLDKLDTYGKSFIDVLLMKFEVSQKMTFDYGQHALGHKIIIDSINLMKNA